MESIKVLVVSTNETLKRNLEEWFASRIEEKSLIIDYAPSRQEAEKLLSNNNYDKIFHNGVYIIDAIESLQFGSDVYHFGKTQNHFSNLEPDINNKKIFSKIFSRKYLKIGANIGGFLGSVVAILVGLIAFISFGLLMRSDIDRNVENIKDNKVEIGEIRIDIKDMKTELNDVGDDAEDALFILKAVYGDKLKINLPSNDKK